MGRSRLAAARDTAAFAGVPAAMCARGGGPSGASDAAVSRRSALRVFGAALGGLAVTLPAHAQDGVNGAKKIKKGARGSKDAKGYQLCLSQCLYDCTTPKAGLAKERAECRVECKDECAVSREQL